jgi:molybdenum cofactor synthesis domain
MTQTCNEHSLLTYDQALEKVLATVKVLPREKADLDDLLNRYLAEPITAAFDLPRFDNSAVDGFGVLLDDVEGASKDNPRSLKLVESVRAGESSTTQLQPGQTIKILTGAPVPSSVEAVIMREYCIENGDEIKVSTNAEPSANIRRSGEECKKGSTVMPSGICATPPVIGLIASFGEASFTVHQRPRIAIVTTGDELVKPGGTLKGGQIFESNSYGLRAALIQTGIDPGQITSFHCRDTREETRQTLSEALSQSDVVISAGGVSVGDRDFVKVVFEQDLNVTKVFWKVAVKPGKPVFFGYVDVAQAVDSSQHSSAISSTPSNEESRRKLIFGLPGNPVSALVTFELFVKPALLKMQGAEHQLVPVWKARTDGALKKRPGRLDFVRGILKCSPEGALHVLPTRGQDSHMLSGLAKANCLIHFDADSELIPEGELVNIQSL